MNRVSPSILSADFVNLERDIRALTPAGADYVHVDVMDGLFVPNISIGLPVVSAILRLPYPVLVATVVGVTNVIPFFGPIIGAVPCAFLILLVNPLQCFYFVIFVICLQQLDGNVIGPKILGNTIGISGFWVLVSITVAAGLFGFAGMLLGVPVFAIIYMLISDAVNLALKKKGMKIPTSAVRAGLADVHWPGRLEYFGRVLLDGAHNDPGVRALCGYLDKWMPKENTVLISAMMRDKETEKMCQRLASRVRCVVCTQPNIPRAMPAEELAEAFEAQGLRAYARTHVKDALEEARRLAGPEGNVVCADSLYLIGEMRTLLRMERGNVGTPSQILPET